MHIYMHITVRGLRATIGLGSDFWRCGSSFSTKGGALGPLLVAKTGPGSRLKSFGSV